MNLMIFVDWYSLLIVLGLIALTLIVKKEVRKDYIINSALFASFLGPIIGYILLLQNISDPKAMGPAIAVSLLSFLYGVSIAFITYLISNMKISPIVFLLPFVGMVLSTQQMLIIYDVLA